MNKLTKSIFLTALMSVSVSAYAELERLPSSVVVPDNMSVKVDKVKPTIRSTGAPVTQKSIKDYGLDKNQLFRCWQYGQLIVAENGFRTPSAAGQTLLSKNGKRLTGFDFGETFCLYMGE